MNREHIHFVTGRLAEHALRATLENELVSERARELAGRLAELGSVEPDPELVLR